MIKETSRVVRKTRTFSHHATFLMFQNTAPKVCDWCHGQRGVGFTLESQFLHLFEIWMYLVMLKKGSLSMFNVICKTFQGYHFAKMQTKHNFLPLHLSLPKRGHVYRGIYLYAKIERCGQVWKSMCTLTTTPAKKAPISRFSNTTPPFHLIIW